MPIVGSFAGASSRAYGLQAGLIGDFESITTTTVGAGGVSSITFSNIPSTYSHLQIRCLVRTTQTGDSTGSYIGLQFNADTANNYSYHNLKGDGSTATSANITSTNQSYADRFTTAFQSANTFGVGIIDILDYKDTNKFKTVRVIAGWDNNGSGQVALNSGNWRSTSAITSIVILPPANNFAQYSQFALYGIKG